MFMFSFGLALIFGFVASLAIHVVLDKMHFFLFIVFLSCIGAGGGGLAVFSEASCPAAQ